MLDNIPHIKAYWILMDVPIAQLALSFGADDVDGTVVEEKIYHEAGATTPQKVQRAELVQWIRDTAVDELRELAVGRLLLDNIPHIKAYWILMDVPIAQLALSFGADDVDGTVVEEKIYHEAGATTPQKVQRAELVQWIRDTAVDELRELAVGRLLLDNIPHIKAYWILMDVPIAQLALSFGADDVDGTVVEEKIYHEAGATTPQKVQRAELVQWIRDAGRVPVERDTIYNVVWSGDESLARAGEHAPVAG